MRFRYFRSLLSLLILLCAAPAAYAEDVVLQLKWFHQFQFAGYYAAVHEGYYAAEGLNVTIRPRDPEQNPLDQVLSGKAEFGVSDASLVLHRLRGRPVVVVAAIFQHSPLVLLARADAGIIGPLELKGKRVMTQAGVDDAAITAMLHQAGLRPDDVIHIPHDFDDLALLHGKADAMSAYLTNQPDLYRNKGYPVQIINPLNYGVDFYGDMLFTSETFMRERPEMVERFRRASLRGWRYALQHKEQVIQWLVQDYGVKQDPRHLRYEAEMTDKMILPNLIDIGHLNPNRFRWIADIYRNEGMAPADTNLQGLIYTDYLGANQRHQAWLGWAAGIAVALLAATLFLAIINRRLSTLVESRTADLSDARDRLQYYVDVVNKYVITSSTDSRGIITHVSDAFAGISKYAPEELIGRNHNIVRHPDMPADVYEELWRAISSGESWHGELLNRAKDGSSYWVDAHIDPRFDEEGNIVGYTAIRNDITDKKRIEELSTTDQLTGLANRRKLTEEFQRELQRGRRYGSSLAIILVDVDHFKQVNDTHGHDVGDRVLYEFAVLLRNHVRKADIPGRWGGEEFIVLCPETDLDGALVVAENLRLAVESHPFPVVERKTASFGVAASVPDDDQQTLVKRADQALYRAKHEGRNCIRGTDA